MAVTDLIKVQVGQETTWGDSVAGTAILMGVTDATVNVVDEVHQSAEMGAMYPSDVVAEVSQHAEGSITMDLSYQDILYPLDNMFEEESPADASPLYTWTYVAPTTAVLVGNVYTLEFGATGAEYEVSGALFTGGTISGEAGGIWTGEFPFVGQDVDDDTMATLAGRTVGLIRMADTVLSIDTWTGTMGTTPVTTELIGFELAFETGRHLKYFNGAVAPGNYGCTKHTGTLTLKLEFSTVTKAIVDALSVPGLVQRQIRLKATSSTHTAQIDFAGTLVGGVPLFDDRDGNITVSLPWVGTWHDTDVNWLEFIVANDIASLT